MEMTENYKQEHTGKLRTNSVCSNNRDLLPRPTRALPVCNEIQWRDVSSPFLLCYIPIKKKKTKCCHCVKQEPLWTKSLQTSGCMKWWGLPGLQLSHPALLAPVLRAGMQHLGVHHTTVSGDGSLLFPLRIYACPHKTFIWARKIQSLLNKSHSQNNTNVLPLVCHSRDNPRTEQSWQLQSQAPVNTAPHLAFLLVTPCTEGLWYHLRYMYP